MVGQFAKSTSVSVEKTRGEIETVLRRYGADGFRYGWNQSIAQIEFSAQGRLVRFTLRLPDPEADRFVMTPAGKKRRSRDQQLAAWEQECRSLWRALLLAIRAKLESTEIGLSAFEQEFFAFIVDPLTNRTVYDEVRTALEARYDGHDQPLIGLPAPEGA